MTDLILRALGAPEFTWGSAHGNALSNATEVRARDVAALRAGDVGDCEPLLFLRSFLNSRLLASFWAEGRTSAHRHVRSLMPMMARA